MKQGLVVAGVGTDVGKTVAAAALCEALEANYWKPVASGSEDGPTDGEHMARLLRGGTARILPTTYSFTKSLSPHIAASLDSQEIELEKLTLPVSDRPIVVELAGGVAVPLNDRHTNLDFLQALRLPVVLVSRHYLGSINHTLLTIDALQRRDIAIAGIIFNGNELPDTERIITKLSGVSIIGRIPQLDRVDAEAIAALGKGLNLTAL